MEKVTWNKVVTLAAQLWNKYNSDRDNEFWNRIVTNVFESKIKELQLYERHFGNRISFELYTTTEQKAAAEEDKNSKVIMFPTPPLGFFSVIPVEILQLIFDFVSVVDVCQKVKRVCRLFKDITDENLFWKRSLENNWGMWSRGTATSDKLDDIKDIQWSIQERGYFKVCRTLLLQSNNTQDKEWTIKKGRVSNTLYEGEGCHNNREGRGRYQWPSGQIYEGEWKNGHEQGSGVLKFPNGCIYEGEFKSGKRRGRGVYKWCTGDIYEGGWEDNHKHGFGVMRYADGDYYEGFYQSDKKQGMGKWIYSNGDVYNGQMVNNEMEGIGYIYLVGWLGLYR